MRWHIVIAGDQHAEDVNPQYGETVGYGRITEAEIGQCAMKFVSFSPLP